MVTRVFVGWNEPFVGLAADFLLSRAESLPETLVIVPTSQAGRQLRKAMASRAGAMLSPMVTTPGGLMHCEDANTAGEWLERLAWQEVLENEADLSQLEALFPEPPDLEGDWAGGLASEMTDLRRTLQENGLTLQTAARNLGSSIEAERWRALSRLEQQVERWIGNSGHQSRSSKLASGLPLPPSAQHVILAGISELPPVVERSLITSSLPITSMIAAPESMADHFSETGMPLTTWSEVHLPWPDTNTGSVRVTADTTEQAREARDVVASAGTPIGQLALGATDSESGEAIAREFTNAGWVAHHPGASAPISGLRRWLKHWTLWLRDPSLATLAELLLLPETETLIEGDRATLANNLSKLRDQWMVSHPEDIRHQIKHAGHRRLKQEALNVIKAAESLEKWRKLCLGKDVHQGIAHLLDALEQHSAETAAQTPEYHAWLQQAQPTIQQLQRPATFWIELMLSSLPIAPPQPPDDRAIDVQGWLELFYEPGSHLVIAGLNEGKLPASGQGDPWLGESGKKLLGLITDKDRAARDAFLLHSMLQARVNSHGRVDMMCTRSSDTGEPMIPSRLLLTAPPEELPARITTLFRKIEPPDAKLRWHADWKWRPPSIELAKRLSATSFGDYIACPYRFYLKHALRLQDSEPERVEWNARDFGNIVHNTLENWGNDTDARALEDPKSIHEWLLSELNRQVDRLFGQRIPLAVRIQTESIGQRLQWFSEVQAKHHADGWDVIEVEHKFEIQIGDTTVAAKIDRIDRHRDTGALSVIDYKTGKDAFAESAHRSQWRENSSLPDHIDPSDPVIYTRIENGKEKRYRWKNLQLPIYALAIQQRDQQLASPCYFKLGETNAEVAINSWDNFEEADLEAALECAKWVTEQISMGVFWPPAKKVDYDDYEAIASGRPMHEIFEPLAMAAGNSSKT